MKIECLKISDLTPADYNPRQIDERALKGLDNSIQRWGLVQPIIFNQRTGNVVGGHQRLAILQTRGETEVDCVVVDLPESEEKALNIALNNKGIQGEFTNEVADILSELQSVPDLDFSSLGFDDLLSQFNPPMPAEAFGQEFDESVADDVKPEIVSCPHCGKTFTK